ncbi:MAG: quinolinate synthase NadA [Candidatus Omnitrophota bacterium]
MEKLTDTQLIKRINELKKKKNAILLVHNYQLPEIQDIADFTGDSLELSRKAAKTNADVIIFCGVHFMAETAAIICPEKLVLMPDPNAGCPMANMITAAGLRALKKEHPKATVVGYVNTPADVKAECDVCCTSTNAVWITDSLKDAPEIIFVPDKYLATYVASKTHKTLIPWNGYCPTHVRILTQDILKQKKLHPKAEVMVHPECTPDVTALADVVLSTSKMCEHAKVTKANELIVGTEIGLLHRLHKDSPNKKFYPASDMATCPNMKKNTLEKVLVSLENMKHEVKVPGDIRIKARRAIDRMLAATV